MPSLPTNKVVDFPLPTRPLNPINYYIIGNLIWIVGLIWLNWSIDEVFTIFIIEVLLFIAINFIRLWLAKDHEKWWSPDTIALKAFTTVLYVATAAVGLVIITLVTGADRSLLSLEELNKSVRSMWRDHSLIVSFIIMNNIVNLFVTYFYSEKYKIANPLLITIKTFLTLLGMSVYMSIILLFIDPSGSSSWKVLAVFIVILKAITEIAGYIFFNKRWPDFEELKTKNPLKGKVFVRSK